MIPWKLKQSEIYDVQMFDDMIRCISSFVSGSEISFSYFKSLWKNFNMSQLHHLCPVKCNFDLYQNLIFHSGIVVFN